ncbi:hypothetical protein [Aurantimonas sp. VKM B-3413]|uniref:hypothetical protein n=1 Tax=Aurantimonas sp. VKM B-3413 TaxID=2779401 RepID=UPI00351CDAF0
MHRGDTDHFHPYDMPHGHVGHNDPKPAAQWQTPHQPEGAAGEDHHHTHEADFDLVEKAFVDSFPAAPDPTSFLRLAGIPFEARLGDGTVLKLLRVAQDVSVDIGSLSPHLGGETFRYDPLPAAMVSRRAALRFVYFDGARTRALTLEEAKGLPARG